MKRNIMAITGSLLVAVMLVFAGCDLGGAEDPQTNLAAPYISVQPESSSFYTDNYVPPTLKIEIWDWESKDGSISYQWYQFDDIEAYCANSGGTEISGARSNTYTPTGIIPVAGEKHYFYAMVTNTNSDALDMSRMSIQSEVVTIAFSDPDEPLVPIIVKNPANATYNWGRSLNPLKVEARLPKDAAGTLTYQWYSNAAFSIEDAEAVAAADKSTFIPGYDALEMDKNYYFAVVTNTITTGTGVTAVSKTARATSIPAIVTMEPGFLAATPRIEVQPASRLYFTGETVQPLSVTAESPDNGELSYQWFSSDLPVTKDGDPIEGANQETFTPSATRFYYVEVTNTNNNVSGQNTAMVASKSVQVRIGATAESLTANATVTIPDLSVATNLRQYVRGYGGMDVGWDNFPRTDPKDTELMYDPDRMGYNILRVMIRPDNLDIKKTMYDLVEGGGSRPGYYENAKIVNKYGGYVAAAPWTPPKEWKSNNSINGGGNLIPAYYRLFANYLRTFAQLMYDKGAPIYCISISNEPNYVAGYDGCEWSANEMRDFWLEVGHFTNGIRGYGGGKEIPYVLTMNGESANTPYINRAALQNPKSRAVIDLLARHIYGSRTDSLYNNTSAANNDRALLTRADGTLTEVWMTEHNINSANATGYYNDSTWNYIWRYLNDVDLVMRINNENAFVWWASKRFYSMIGDGQFGTTDGDPLPRGWALTHYARYTIDTTRIAISMTGTTAAGTPIGTIERPSDSTLVNNTKDDLDNTSARITAYVSADGNAISMVMWTPTKVDGNGGHDMGTIKINFPEGFIVNGVTAHRSTSKSNIFQPDDTVVLSADRKSAYVSLPRSNMLSVKFTKSE